jgi:hypothetical protein
LKSSHLYHAGTSVCAGFCCSFDGLGPLVCSNSELTSETMNSFRHFGRTPWAGGSVYHKACTYTAQLNTEQRGHRSITRAGFEPTTAVLLLSKTTRALDCSATGIGAVMCVLIEIQSSNVMLEWLALLLGSQTHLHLVPRSKNEWSDTSTPPIRLHGVVLS